MESDDQDDDGPTVMASPSFDTMEAVRKAGEARDDGDEGPTAVSSPPILAMLQNWEEKYGIADREAPPGADQGAEPAGDSPPAAGAPERRSRGGALAYAQTAMGPSYGDRIAQARREAEASEGPSGASGAPRPPSGPGGRAPAGAAPSNQPVSQAPPAVPVGDPSPPAPIPQAPPTGGFPSPEPAARGAVAPAQAPGAAQEGGGDLPKTVVLGPDQWGQPAPPADAAPQAAAPPGAQPPPAGPPVPGSQAPAAPYAAHGGPASAHPPAAPFGSAQPPPGAVVPAPSGSSSGGNNVLLFLAGMGAVLVFGGVVLAAVAYFMLG